MQKVQFDANNSGYGYEKSAIDKLRLRNLSVAYELLIADKVISPRNLASKSVAI